MAPPPPGSSVMIKSIGAVYEPTQRLGFHPERVISLQHVLLLWARNGPQTVGKSQDGANTFRKIFGK